MLGRVGLPELAIILGILVLIFGPKRLPQFGRAIGDTIRELRGVKKEIEDIHDQKVDL